MCVHLRFYFGFVSKETFLFIVFYFFSVNENIASRKQAAESRCSAVQAASYEEWTPRAVHRPA